MKTLLTILIFSLFSNSSFSQLAKTQKDTLPLNEIANRQIANSIKRKPPIIDVFFYLNGKMVKNNFNAYLLVNNTIQGEPSRKKIVLKKDKFKEGDTLQFLIRYKNLNIYSNKLGFKNFLCGGQLIAGLVSDYEKEKIKFISDTSNYLIKNQENQLYEILIITRKHDSEFQNKKFQLEYCVVKSNIYSGVNFKYQFKPVEIINKLN